MPFRDDPMLRIAAPLADGQASIRASGFERDTEDWTAVVERVCPDVEDLPIEMRRIMKAGLRTWI
jgi:hypothetical protein